MKKNKLSGYKAVILAGGKGTRLYPVTLETPKPLLLVNKKPIINHLVDLFYSQGIKDIAILIDKNFKEDFVWWRKRYYPKNNILFIEERKPLGTFGGLWFLKKWIAKSLFFLVNADNLMDIKLDKMADFHKNVKLIGTIALVKIKDPREYGAVIFKSNLITKFVEKPKKLSSKYINSGWYLFSPEIFDYHLGPKFLMIEKDIFPKLAREKKLAGFKFNGKWMDTGNWERYAKAIKEWKS